MIAIDKQQAAPQRRLPLEGAINFRDLGGYASVDGRRVRWGQLYRSDSLAELSDADRAAVAKLGIRSLCDLRYEAERTHKPNRLWDDPRLQTQVIGFEPYLAADLLDQVHAGKLSSPEIEARVCEIYRRFVTDHAEAYVALLDCLLADDPLPLLFHCTSGRDRTGFGAAVVLLALDVPRATIAEDYALTNRYRRDLSFQLGNSIPAGIMNTLTQAHPSYLAASFRAIDEGWGDEETYLRDALGLSAKRRRALQTRLLEAV